MLTLSWRSGLDQGPDLPYRLTVQAAHGGECPGNLHAPGFERGEPRRTHRPLRAVGDLQRHAPAFLASDSKHGLGPALDEEVRRVHQLRVEPSRPRDHKRMIAHRIP